MNEKAKNSHPKTLREALNLFQSEGVAAKKSENSIKIDVFEFIPGSTYVKITLVKNISNTFKVV